MNETCGISIQRHLLFFTVWVDLAGHLQGLRRGHVRVGRGDGQDDAVWVGDVLQDEISYLNLDVLRLIANGHLTGGSERHQQTEGRDRSASKLPRGNLTARRRRRQNPKPSVSQHLAGKERVTFVIPGRSTRVRLTT